MELKKIEDEIYELVEKRTEGLYWDFKKQWHEFNTDLLHDIICMANSPANRDCYIIIGVEDEKYTFCGVEEKIEKNSKM